MKKLLDLRFGQEERLAKTLQRLCYPIALSMEVRQPASALRLLESSHDTAQCFYEVLHPFGKKGPERSLARALLSVKCTRAILRNVRKDADARNRVHREAARITAALEIAERLIESLNNPPATAT
jgi:hypothetical protein